MRKHCYEDLDRPIQQLMQILRQEYPNGFELVITSDYAELRHVNTELNFLNTEFKQNPLTAGGVSSADLGDMLQVFVQLIDRFKTDPKSDESK